MAACERVLNTYELLESVLAELSPYELGTATQVCKTWQTMISESTRIADITPLVPTQTIWSCN